MPIGSHGLLCRVALHPGCFAVWMLAAGCAQPDKNLDTGYPTHGTDAATLIDASTDANGEIDQACAYYSDPNTGDPANDGSKDFPWGSLESIAAAAPSLELGAVVCLRGGDHGSPQFVGHNYSDYAAFVAVQGEQPRLSCLDIRSSSYLVFDGLLVDGAMKNDPTADEKESFLVTGDLASHHIRFQQVEVRSALLSDTWTKDDWYKQGWSGIDMRGSHMTIDRCRIINTYHAISLRGDHSTVTHSLVDNFAGDGIRGLGSFSTYEFNIVRDAYIDDYAIQHDDAFQAFNLGGDPKIESVVIRNNQFMQFLDPITPFVTEHQLVSTELQGIIITDGYADSWVVENNLVSIDHVHGITLFGARHCRVQNNTVVQSPHTVDTDVPWIWLTDQSKTAHENFDNIVRNNLATKLTVWDYDSTSRVENNVDIDEFDQDDYRQYFADYDNQDFHQRVSSPSVNAGTNEQTSAFDLDGNARISGVIVDSGAYEFQQP